MGSKPELSMCPPSPILYLAAAFGPGTFLEVIGHIVVTGINACMLWPPNLFRACEIIAVKAALLTPMALAKLKGSEGDGIFTPCPPDWPWYGASPPRAKVSTMPPPTTSFTAGMSAL
eukprot:Skav229634  [mRNA]  locus=scaffold649:217272:219557:+ [translate_table: standard]